MIVPFLDLQAQYRSLKPELDAAVGHVLATSTYVLGPSVRAFEESFAAFCGTRHCVGVASGTAALELLLRAYGIGQGDEVITVANSFFASAEAISLVGATPVLVDCRADDALIDVDAVEAAVTARTKAIIPVHLYGQCADMDGLRATAARHRLVLIEDACQAHGAGYKGARAGSLADAAAFSFYPGKNLGAYGEAGAITTNDGAIAERVRMLREHGMPRKYEHALVGRNDRMDGIQGAVLGVKLPHLDGWNAQRRAHARRYRNSLADSAGVTLLTEHPDREHGYHLFVIRVPERDRVRAALAEHGINAGVHYPIPIHLQAAYADRGWKRGDFPEAEAQANDVLSLPMFPELTDAQIDAVVTALRAAL
ncbi:MAG: DegT/DnrJ/EryC1/StrS aminotransferase [Candidatus Peregrinibacteria bacterium Gr01-1014_25]|nr:MAG: DegT/DnrJ/EryC1/StrS aminotransferase [Candidatus Peregrinibacteria bacterium Gr01-1014_25]